jgi:hypothetical protein
MKALWASLWILLGLGQFCTGPAAILEVPADYPGIQAAMDASSPGDTVHVAPGIWYGLYTSPVHSLTLCSDYLFTQDSTGINETILDGEYAGTILDVVCLNNWFNLCGFTIQHGQGVQPETWSSCYRAGAIHVTTPANAEIRDVVFRENRATHAVPVLYQGQFCSRTATVGDLILRNIACYNNAIDDTLYNPYRAFILINARESRLIVDGLYFDGAGGSTAYPMYAYTSRMDSVRFNNIHIVNCARTTFRYTGGTRNPNGHSFTNMKSTDARGPNRCRFSIQASHQDIPAATVVLRNIELRGLTGSGGSYFYSSNSTFDFDSLTVSNCRFYTSGWPINIWAPGLIRNLNMYGNTHGDSINLVPSSLFFGRRISIDQAWVRDNHVIVPPDPDVATTGGNHVYGAMVQALDAEYLTNMLFENNFVDDLDDYSSLDTYESYLMNNGRELAGFGANLTVRNIVVRNSRQPNHTPELYSPADIDASRPGSTISLSAVNHLVVDSIRIESADDGGLRVGADSLWVSNVELRDVDRVAIMMPRNESPTAPPSFSFRNILVDNTDAYDNLLAPDDTGSNQAVLFLDVRGDWGGTYPTVDFENVTAVNCDGMRHLFNFYEPVDLRVRNCLFYNNTYDQLIQWDEPILQTWEYNMLQEEVPGIGNQVGLDPWFDEELGAPWLSPDSPAIDAGHPDLVYNDIEDPDTPGFALWPSQGTLRNDIGYTGGPYAGTLEHLVTVRPPATGHPATQPQGFTLHPAYPNPFNPSTTLSYTLARPMQVELSVYNLLGQQVRTLVFGLQDAGEHSVPFIAGELASGVYVVELQAGGHSQTQKVLLLK